MKIVLTIFCCVAGLFLLLVAASFLGELRCKNAVRKDALELFSAVEENGSRFFDDSLFMLLPVPVQRWIDHSGVRETGPIRTVRQKHKGWFRRTPEEGWKKLSGEEYHVTGEPAFLWFGKIRMMPFLSITGEDRYIDGKGSLRIRLLSLFPVVNYSGPSADQAEMIRFFSEMIWYPDFALSKYVRWEPVDSSSARGIMNYRGMEVSGIFHFDQEGNLTNFTGQRSTGVNENGDLVFEKWATPITGHTRINGLSIPLSGSGVYHYRDGDFEYIRLEGYESIEFNPSGTY